MSDKIVQDLLSSMFEQRHTNGGSFSISIPKTHPRAKEIAHLVQKLATKIVLESGLELSFNAVDGVRRVEIFTEVVREICEESGVDFDRMYREAFGDKQSVLVGSPLGSLPQLMEGFFGAGLLAKIQPDKRTELANIVSEATRRAGL